VSELHRFVFDGLPVRGALVRLTDAWQEILRRRQISATGAWPQPLRALLGEMTAAGVLMQANIKFDGALILQIFGDGPVKLAVAEVQADLRLRATATVAGEVAPSARLSDLVNVANQGRCAITLDPLARRPGQRPYQGVVPLFGDRHEKLEALGAVLEHYMLQSEQVDTRLVLAADDRVAAGLLIQRMPAEGGAAAGAARPDEERIGLDEDYNRIATLAASLTRDELLTLDVDTVLRRLFWQERLQRFAPRVGADGPRFACTCSSERVANMIRGLGQGEATGIIAERGQIEVGCEFCGRQYRFDAIDAAQLFAAPGIASPGSSAVH
jgi:molecular chaperone Hsp33